MELIVNFLNALNTLSPLAVIALLSLVLFYQAKNSKNAHTQASTIATIKSNDLHELPAMAENLRIIAATIQRIEVEQGENFSYLKARLNGGGSRDSNR